MTTDAIHTAAVNTAPLSAEGVSISLHTWFDLWEAFIQVLNRDSLFILCFVYPLGIVALDTVAKRRQWGDLAAPGSRLHTPYSIVNISYNIAMSIFSLVVTVLTLDAMRRLPIMLNDCELYNNDPVFNSAMWYFYLSKYVEFVDTIFLIVRGKDVSWLHYLHHIGAPINMGIIYWSRIEAGWIFSLLNGIIHTFMYAYFAAASMKVKVPKFFKMSLTTLQILQFLTGFTILYHYAFVPCWAASAERMAAWWYTYFYVGTVLVLFVSFYLQTYFLTQRKKK